MKRNCLLLMRLLIVSVLLVTGSIQYVHAQKGASYVIKGTVTNEKGEVLQGAVVEVMGTNQRSLVDASGKYSISAKGKGVLLITFVGYADQTVAFNESTTTINVVMTVAVKGLDDVVVTIGYTTVKKRDVTGAVGTIGEQDIKSRPVDNTLQAIQGKVAGVDVSSNERPGTLGSMTIRGVRSLGTSTGTVVTGASNSPLFVVDNIPLISGGIDNIDPQDIESIDILKDASATAIYGSRGANGVVIITTKQAKAGKVTLSLNSSTTLENIVDNENMFNAGDFITFRRWAYYYAGYNYTTHTSSYTRGDQPTLAQDKTFFSATADPYAWANIAQGWASGTWDPSKVKTTDWRGMVKQQSVTTDNILSVSGGTDKIKAYGSFGYLNNKGTIKGQSFERYTANTKVDIAATKWLTFGTNINISYGKQEYGQSNSGVGTVGNPQGGLYESARAVFPFAVPYDSAGNRISFPGGDNAIKTIVDEWKYNTDERITLRAFASLSAQVNFGEISPILKGLKYRLNFGPDLSYYRDGVYIDKNSVANGGSSSYAALTKTNTYSYTLDNLLYYDRSFGDHTIGVTLLQSATAYRQETSNITGLGVPYTSQLWNNLSSGVVTGSLSASSGLTQQQLASYMGRINYSYRAKYLATVSAREDGSSVLAAGHKYSWFPSAALAWVITKEKFMNVSWVNDLKLRVGAGVTGNSSISPYATQGGVTSLFYPFLATNTSGSIPNATLANQNLAWEKTTQYNLGIDYVLLKRRISGSIDVYKSNTSNLLQLRTLPSVTGYTATYENVGKTANVGIDISITTTNIKLKNLTWTTTLNASWQKDHIVSLVSGTQADIGNGWFPGNPISVIYGYKALGLWQASDSTLFNKFNSNGNAFHAGNVRVQDLNGDNKIDPNNDQEILGWTRPRWVVGMSNEVNYKHWAFSIFLYGRLHYMYSYGGETEPARYLTRAVNYYNENNTTNAQFQKPIFNAGGAALDVYYAALGYLNGSFIKIRNMSLGYNFNSEKLANSGVSNLRLYLQVQNPGMLFSKVKFLDMDVLGPTWNRGFTLGMNASF